VVEDNALELRVVHRCPGRIRLKFSREATDNPALRTAEEQLAREPGIHQVRINRSAHSVAIGFDPETVSLPSLMDLARRSGLSIALPDPVDAQVKPIGQTVADVTSRANRRVQRATGGAADLKFLVPAGLTLWAVREVVAGRGLTAVPWYTLSWYAFSMFEKYLRPSGRPTAEDDD
jgi:hypothetical protein